ncbi:hypothetical protein MKW98_027404 [Papaver atlanticum]|uniref:PGG domain-containing protein n=1 Tax=Papaver atlanticum TaxID=357466 RepID=A0AAD4THA6_9MAGN|nr:hypothetical protein MKW98_027404 [Papaver atlanticum]
MSDRDHLGTDPRSHQETIDIKTLLKLIVETQAKQEESQQQIIEILRSTKSSAGDTHKPQGEGIGKNADKEEIIGDTANDNDNQQAAEVEVNRVAIYVPGKNDQLYGALSTNNMEKVKEILKNNPGVVEEGITHDSSTVLHTAVHWRMDILLIQEIVELMSPCILEYKTNKYGYTACHRASIYGYAKAAEVMVNKNPKLTQIRDFNGSTPLELALQYPTTGQKEIVKYLYSVTRDEDPSPFLGQDGVRLLHKAIDANFYDMALNLVKRFPKLVTEKSLKDDICGLEVLVRRPFAFKSGAKLTWWQDRIYSLIEVDMNSTYVQPVEPSTNASSTIDKRTLMPYLMRVPHLKKLYNLKLMHEQAIALLKQMLTQVNNNYNNPGIRIFFQNDPGIRIFFQNNSDIIKVAIKHGIIEVVVEVLEQFPYLIWYPLPHQRMIGMAIAERNENMVSLICDLGDVYGDKFDLVSTTDDEKNTILHYAAKLAPSARLNLISGVALQMQREVQWFKGVESIMMETDWFKRNKKGDTAQHLFTIEHKDLLKEAENWMKDTSGSCMVVAALIATVAFAAAFTVPGGNISDTNSAMNGNPVFLGNNAFTGFVVADALALFASITSVLMFLSIYTSRYAEMDFLKVLPQKLIIGFATLFISMAAILVAFGASVYIVVGGRYPWAPIPIALFTSCPILLFACLQLPLFYEMVHSTYRGSILRNHIYISYTVEKNKKKK